ncbi:MAG: sigma-70 family RNA polymerase sigma factor [Verrucomicrobiales bacterium]|nr:sigma-70 family RNA polymerase sigma factor [Verrucomicrobiales bacterium]
MDADTLRTTGTGGEWFATTHWSVVLAAKDRNASPANEALEKLCRTYWPPIYAFIRRQGYEAAEGKDLTQEFFLRLIEREYLKHLRHQRGKFRSFILTFLRHFLQEQRGKAKAQKRGGGMVFVSLDDVGEGTGYLTEPVDKFSPDQVFERRWAQAVFQRAVDRLQEEYVEAGKGPLFDRLKDFQPREPGAPSYAQIGARLGVTEAAVKSAVQRMRQRHREILREEIAHTVTRPEEIEEEIRHLRDVLSEPHP